MSTPYRIERNWWTPYMLGVFFGYHLPRRSRYVGPKKPVYAECPACRATVRVLPSGRWARHTRRLFFDHIARWVLIPSRCRAGGRMADVAPCPDPECTRRGQHGDHWKLSHGHLVKWADSP